MDETDTSTAQPDQPREAWAAPRLEVLSMRSTATAEQSYQSTDSYSDYS